MLSFQCAAVEAEQVCLQQEIPSESQPNSSLPPSSPPASTRPISPVVTEHSPEPPISAQSKWPIILSDDETDEEAKTRKRKKTSVILTDDKEYEKSDSPKQTKGNPKPNGEYRTSLQITLAYISMIATDEDGIYRDITVLDIVLEYRLASLATWCDQHHSLIYLCFKVILHVFKYIFLLRIPSDYHPPRLSPPNHAPAA